MDKGLFYLGEFEFKIDILYYIYNNLGKYS